MIFKSIPTSGTLGRSSKEPSLLPFRNRFSVDSKSVPPHFRLIGSPSLRDSVTPCFRNSVNP